MRSVVISSDPFARTSTVRRVAAPSTATCRWCGASPRPAGEQVKCRSLFEYGTDSDWRTAWHTGVFCSKSCHDSFHG